MTPEDIRQMYRDADPASQQEAQREANEARTDPNQARRLLVTLYALAGEDRDFDQLLYLVLKVGTMQLLVMAAEESDTFALHLAELILDGMETMKPGAGVGKVARGRQAAKKAQSA